MNFTFNCTLRNFLKSKVNKHGKSTTSKVKNELDLILEYT